MTDFRAELQLLFDDAESFAEASLGHHYLWVAALNRARAALVEQPVGPTDEELEEFTVFWWGSYTDELTVTDVIECFSMAAFARAVLAKWGAHPPTTLLTRRTTSDTKQG
jgi:hypothetical protein